MARRALLPLFSAVLWMFVLLIGILVNGGIEHISIMDLLFNERAKLGVGVPALMTSINVLFVVIARVVPIPALLIGVVMQIPFALFNFMIMGGGV